MGTPVRMVEASARRRGLRVYFGLILYSEAFWPVVEALSWYYCCFSQYAANLV
ncbi:hypothetical protein SAMN05216343_1069 [Oscillibacter sp. PC13]|nr:hypothetical protein SAMN05216343_1069 [Oscillibacter sp. PC13]